MTGGSNMVFFLTLLAVENVEESVV